MTTRIIPPARGNGHAPHAAIELPPHDAFAEQAVLCAALASTELRAIVTGALSADDYYIALHQRVHQAIGNLDSAGRSVDVVTIANALHLTDDEWPQLRSIVEVVYPDALTAADHVRIVREHALRRRMIRHARDVLREVRDPTCDVVDVADRYGLTPLLDADATRRAPSRAVYRRLSDVAPENLEWLWPGRIPLGKLTLFAGDPGLGKSFVTLDMAARVSCGRGWPDDYAAGQPQGSVILLSAEDDLSDTIRPRLDAAAADPYRVMAVEAIQDVDPGTCTPGRPRAYSLERDLPALEAIIREQGDTRLIVIDPISAYCGQVDSHKNTDVRALLAPLSELAARHRVAVVAVTHLAKSTTPGKAVYRAMGSLAFAAAARAVWAVSRDRTNRERRLITPAKMNLAPDPTGLAYAIAAGGMVAWEAEPIPWTADDALAAELDPERDDSRADWQEAADWLGDVLSAGPIPAKDAKALARENGISDKTLRMARERLGVVTRREGFGRGSQVQWELPGQPETHIDAHGTA